MAENKRMLVNELDFDKIKENLITFMEGQSEFSDYDFTGSALNVLIDLLSYNTHYHALYLNLAVNEMFLDSASKRNSVVSRGRELGYTPTSYTAPKAVLNITVNGSGIVPQIITLPRYSQFTTTLDGVNFNYYTLEDMSAIKDVEGNFTFENVEIFEGYRLNYSQEVTANTRFIIPNKGLDVSTLNVTVLEDSSSGIYVSYVQAESILTVNKESRVYFLKEVDNQMYELEFGNGVLGKALAIGQVVNYDYLVTNGPMSNGAITFNYQGNLGGTTTVQTVAASSGGADIEDIESIRFNAPRYYAAQNRAVTWEDYEIIIKKYYPNIETISVWGGEDNTPPVYGKVFICVKPFNALVITQSEKDRIKTEILRTRSVSSIRPEFVDPEYINLELFTTVYYNPRHTQRTAADISTLVIQTIKDYNDENLEKFTGNFRFSQFSRKIDDTERSIVSNISRILIHRPVTPKYNSNATYTVQLDNPIFTSGNPDDSVSSNGFMINGDTVNTYYINDDGVGNLRLYYLINTIKNYTNNKIGTVDYTTGLIKIVGLNIVALVEDSFTLYIKPSSYDVISARNQLVRIPDNLINVSVVVDNTSTSDVPGTSNFIFTPSRD